MSTNYMVRSYQLAIWAIALVLLSLAMPISLARGPHGGGSPPEIQTNTHGGGGAITNNTTKPVLPQSRPATRATQPTESPEVIAAKAALSNAKLNLDNVVRKLQDAFSKSQATQDAQAGLVAATADLKSSRDAVIAKLSSADEYKQALQERDDAKAAMRSSSDEDNTAADLAANQAKYLAAVAKVGKLELDACNADPMTKAAMAECEQARKGLQDQAAQFQDSLKRNPEWLTAKRAVDDAEVNLNAAVVAAKTPQATAK